MVEASGRTNLDIIELCVSLEKKAVALYEGFAERLDDSPERDFWRQLHKDEKSHVKFWEDLYEIGKTTPFPRVFDNPDEVFDDFSRIGPMVDKMLVSCRGGISTAKALLMAYRMEFYMLNTSLQTLFRSLRFFQDDFDPELEYEEHVQRFVDGVIEFGANTPETELLGVALQRLWNENRQLSMQAMTDPLTGIYNRRGFFTIARQLCALMRRNDSPVGMLMVDIDDFKAFNDSRGHLAGDRVLRDAAAAVSDSIRESAIVGRFGGDEFVVLLPDTQSVEMVASKVLDSIRSSLKGDSGATVSIGFSLGRIDGDIESALTALISSADESMYEAKAAGGDCHRGR